MNKSFSDYLESPQQSGYHDVTKKILGSDIQSAKRQIMDIVEVDPRDVKKRIDRILLGLAERAYDKGLGMAH